MRKNFIFIFILFSLLSIPYSSQEKDKIFKPTHEVLVELVVVEVFVTDKKEILTPFLKQPIRNYKLYTILGRALQRLEGYKQAISYYQKFISHKGANYQILNSIAECYYALGNYEEALRAWEKSLEINPAQEEIRKKIENLKKKIKNEKNTSNINSNLLA